MHLNGILEFIKHDPYNFACDMKLYSGGLQTKAYGPVQPITWICMVIKLRIVFTFLKD